MTNQNKLHDAKRIILVLFGGFLLALNITVFIHPSGLIPGGFSGISLLLIDVFHKYLNVDIPFSVINNALNIIPVYIGFKFIGKKFTILSVLMIVFSGLLTDLMSEFDFLKITDDILLCTVFGGILNSVAITCCLMAESSSGGTDFIAIYISEKTGKSAWNYIFIFNCVILVIAGILFGWDKALYSIVFQFASTQALNFFYKKYSKTTLLIITDKSEEIYTVIKNLTNHSATVFEGKGEFSGNKHEMLYTVVSSSESGQLEKAIRTVDPNAFINVLQSKEIIGKFFKRAND